MSPRRAFVGIAALVAAGGCASLPFGTGPVAAEMRSASGAVVGAIAVSETEGGLRLRGMVRNLPPGTHALHLHTVGRCEAPFESAGGHWNPTNREHGRENPRGPHHGDAPNVVVGSDGTASIDVTTPAGTLRGALGLLDGDGAAVVMHAGPDDNRSDPAGNAGARIACGVVR